MRLQVRDNLPFVTVSLVYGGKTLEIPDVLVDTGSGGSVFSVDRLAELGVTPQAEDVLHTIHGVGGSEVVFMRRLEAVQVGEFSLPNFEIEVGGMDYGFDINGILGMDFLLPAGAQIDLKRLVIEF